MPRNPHMRRSKSLSSIHNIKKKRAKERRKIQMENKVSCMSKNMSLKFTFFIYFANIQMLPKWQVKVMKKRLEQARAVYDHKDFVPKHRKDVLKLRSGKRSLFLKSRNERIWSSI
eukprot:UN22697